MLNYNTVLPDNFEERIDCEFYNPRSIEKFRKIKELKKQDRKLVKLYDVVSVKYGKRLPKGTMHSQTENDIIPFIRVSDVQDNIVDLENCAKISPHIYKQLYDHYARKDDIIITIVGTIGEAGIIEKHVNLCGFSDNLARLRPRNHNISPEFVTLFINSELGKVQTKRFSVGSLQYKLSLKNLKNKIEIFIPVKNNTFDIKHQKELVNASKLIEDKARKKLQDYKNKIMQYNKYFIKKTGILLTKEEQKHNTFTINLNNKSDRLDALYNNPNLEQLKNEITKHPHVSLKEIIEIQPKGSVVLSSFYNLVGLEDISVDIGEIINIKEVIELKSGKVTFRDGEILISKLQPEKGKIIIVNEQQEGYLGSGELIPIKIISEKVIDRYLYHMLRSPYILKQWEYSITGCSRERIGKNELYTTLIPLLSKSKQLDLISDLDNLIYKAKEDLNQHYRLKEEAKKMFSSQLIK